MRKSCRAAPSLANPQPLSGDLRSVFQDVCLIRASGARVIGRDQPNAKAAGFDEIG
jgi:hypothetical protein